MPGTARRRRARRLVRAAAAPPDGRRPERVSVDSRTLAPGELFVGLRGERDDGGSYAAQALAAGAWGVLVAPEHASALAPRRRTAARCSCTSDPLGGAAARSRARGGASCGQRREVVAITGSTGKTSTKDILAALLGAQRCAWRRARRTSTPRSACRWRCSGARRGHRGARAGDGDARARARSRELTAIAEPDVGVIVNVGPAHLELLGSLEAIAAAKAELIAGLAPGASVVVPAGEPLLAPHLRADLRHDHLRRGRRRALAERRARRRGADRATATRTIELWPSFAQAHNLRNLLAAVAAARALGSPPTGASTCASRRCAASATSCPAAWR